MDLRDHADLEIHRIIRIENSTAPFDLPGLQQRPSTSPNTVVQVRKTQVIPQTTPIECFLIHFTLWLNLGSDGRKQWTGLTML